jgi:hypothetical protein
MDRSIIFEYSIIRTQPHGIITANRKDAIIGDIGNRTIGSSAKTKFTITPIDSPIVDQVAS